MRATIVRFLLAFGLFAGFAGCLPDDNRPVPGSAVVTVSTEEDLSTAIASADGWEVRFERFLLSLGEVRLDGDDCSQYSESDYVRIFDLLSHGPQRVNLMYALGPCELSFQVRAPPDNAVLGAGVAEEDRAFLRTAGSDVFVQNRGVALDVAGTATRAGTSLRFRWSFRRGLVYEACGVVTFQGEVAQALDVRLRAEALFHETVEETNAVARFDPYAAAEQNGDGEVTIDELAKVPVTDPAFKTLGERLYLGLVPKLVRFREATCSVRALDKD